MFYSIIVFILVAAAYVAWELNAVKNATIMDIMKDFVDVSPCVLMLCFNKPYCIIFLAFCLMANEFIYDNQILGGLLFITAYASASVLSSMYFDFKLVNLIICLIVMLFTEVPILLIYKGSVSEKITIGIYGILSLCPCLYAFSVTFNVGFMLLALGDIWLGIYGAMNNKCIKIVANLFYFAGTCFVPLILRSV